ncbi:Type I restriction-modification system methyltransferase subunit, HsdM [Methanocella conradii HZ254]|uniref:Type I restriction-modification system methyltransferase subunit, HsdM n=1 Tax=Methanocella conradii (strain DSM 24694 / JCM 17849 / CGMCC 1.5162 / HZ254) TaxID=1041930 RepID=H8IA42_METCZ|nr:type I restriction-modification system subunit M N-terminal domain-containing protein [Methanocella conradii]AFC99108.1 Type I restriction-modification system methyltransferase subunit, HsdM [Methanocella conradii HZ254]
MENFSEKVNFIWSIAELLRDSYKRSKYQDVILPFTVLRRIDCVLAPTKEKVLEANARFKGKLDNPGPQLCKASGTLTCTLTGSATLRGAIFSRSL